MRMFSKSSFRPLLTWAALLMLLTPPCAHGEVNNSDLNVWHTYSTEQQRLIIAGFADCYRTSPSRKDAFEQSDYVAVIRMVNEAVNSRKQSSLGKLILESLMSARRAKPDVHAEHWSGPYGFDSGLWWRQISDQNRQAYVQGVFWCAEEVDNIKVIAPDKSVQFAVKQLNDWYVISDEDWKDPRSNARVDVPVVLAMQTSGIISIGQPIKVQ